VRDTPRSAADEDRQKFGGEGLPVTSMMAQSRNVRPVRSIAKLIVSHRPKAAAPQNGKLLTGTYLAVRGGH
jgi:hypothetical protein